MGNPEKLNDDMMEKVAGGTLTQDRPFPRGGLARLAASPGGFGERIGLDFNPAKRSMRSSSIRADSILGSFSPRGPARP